MKTFWLIYGMAVFLLAYILLIRPIVGNINWAESHGYDLDEVIEYKQSVATDRAIRLRKLQGEKDMLQKNQLQAQFDLPNNYYWRAKQHSEFLNGLMGREK